MLQDDLLARVVVLLAVIVAVMLLALLSRARRRMRRGGDRSSPAVPRVSPAAIDPGEPHPVPFSDQMMETMTLEVYRRAFGTTNFNYALLGEHRMVMESVRAAVPQATTRREYFPRRPQIIPRLLSALKNDESSLKELVGIIMQDPVLTGDVLRLANSSFYRIAKEPIDTIGRAVVLLGVDGLRSLIATSLMQPVFQVPRGYFDDFSTTIWELARNSAFAAQGYARVSKECDGFTAHLLVLLYHMSYIVMFRLTVDRYVQAAGSLPRAEVFARLIDERAEELTGLIAAEWEMSEPIQAALAEHAARLPVNHMSPLGRALYFGRACGMATILAAHDTLDEAALQDLLQRKGLSAEQAEALWQLAAAPLRDAP
jgi:HD-like signal output (HDOD) protein